MPSLVQAQTEVAERSLSLLGQERQAEPRHLWEGEIGDGFRSGAESVNVSVGVHGGFPIFGGHRSHHLVLTSLSYGRMVGPVMGEGRWFRGNWELRGELFGGSEFFPETEWIIGLSPHLRYHFATGTRWVPFADIAAGVTATSIGPPDLSGIFEFNLKAGGGVHWFLRDDLALSLETYYMHLSCAGMSDPNQGLNGIVGMIGISKFF